MAEDITTFGLKPENLGRILKLCCESGQHEWKMEINEQKAELLQDRLSETLLSGSLKDSPLRKELTDLCRMSGLLAGEMLRNLLSNPDTDIELIRKTKEHGKKLSQAASNDLEHDVANVIYFAAIAHAMVFHKLKITKFTYDDLWQSFSVLGKIKWISSDLVELFKKAGRYCREKLNNSNKA